MDFKYGLGWKWSISTGPVKLVLICATKYENTIKEKVKTLGSTPLFNAMPY